MCFWKGQGPVLGITDHGKQSPRLAKAPLEAGKAGSATDTILIAISIGCPGSWGDRPSLLMLVRYSVMGVRQCERWCVCVCVCM